MKYNFILLSIVLLSVFVSFGNAVDYCLPLYQSLMFYKAQRAGKLPDSDVSWRGDSVLNDGSSIGVDLSGGYFDAADYIKFTFPLSYVLTTLGWSYVQFTDNIVNKCHLQNEYLSVLKWGTDWLMAAHYDSNHLITQIDSMDSHSNWNKPSDVTYARRLFSIDNTQVCTDVAMQSAAALGISSLAFASVNSTYSAQLLTKAKSLYALGKACPAGNMAVPDSSQGYPSSGYQDEQIWASIIMYLATGRSTSTTYYSDLTSLIPTLQGRYFTDIWSTVISWDSKYSAAAMMAYKSLSSDPNFSSYNFQTNANAIFNTWSNQAKYNGIVSSSDGWQWGNNRYSMGGAFLATLLNTNASMTWAAGQVNCVLGICADNSQSYVIGYGTNYAKFPHHRAAHNPTPDPNNGNNLNMNYPVATTYTLIGALIGGPSLQNTNYQDQRSNYVQNEPAIDYNAGFTGALAGLVNAEHTTGYPTSSSGAATTSTTTSTSTTGTTGTTGTSTSTTSKPTTTSTSTSTTSTTSRPTTTTTSTSTTSTTSKPTTTTTSTSSNPTTSTTGTTSATGTTSTTSASSTTTTTSGSTTDGLEDPDNNISSALLLKSSLTFVLLVTFVILNF